MNFFIIASVIPTKVGISYLLEKVFKGCETLLKQIPDIPRKSGFRKDVQFVVEMILMIELRLIFLWK